MGNGVSNQKKGSPQNLAEVLFLSDRETLNTAFPIVDSTFTLGYINRFVFVPFTNETLSNDIDVIVGISGGSLDGMEYKVGNYSDYVVTLVPDTGITLLADELVIPKNHTAIIKFLQISIFPVLNENTFSVTYESNIISEAVQRSTATSGKQSAPDTNKEVIFIHEAGATASLTYEFPPNPVDKQKVTIMSVGGITALTLSAAIGTIVNTITTLALGGSATYMYLSSQTKWYKIG